MFSIDENLDEILCETTLIRSDVGVSGSFGSGTSSTSNTMNVVLIIDEEGERESQQLVVDSFIFGRLMREEIWR